MYVLSQNTGTILSPKCSLVLCSITFTTGGRMKRWNECFNT